MQIACGRSKIASQEPILYSMGPGTFWPSWGTSWLFGPLGTKSLHPVSSAPVDLFSPEVPSMEVHKICNSPCAVHSSDSAVIRYITSSSPFGSEIDHVGQIHRTQGDLLPLREVVNCAQEHQTETPENIVQMNPMVHANRCPLPLRR